MKIKKSTVFVFLVLVYMSISALAAPASAVEVQFATSLPVPLRVTILFMNDIHGNLLPYKINWNDQSIEVGGIARVAKLVKDIKAADEAAGAKTVFLLAGDILQGTPMSTVFGGRADIECFNAMGVAASTVGNHEFDFGLANFNELRQLAKFPFLSSNIVWKGSKELLCDPTYTIRLGDGLDITVIGATTRELLTSTAPDNVSRLDVLDPVGTVKKYYELNKAKGPVILLSHSRLASDSEIARKIPGLLMILGGHDQILFNPYKEVNGVPIFQAFERCKYLGRVDLLVEPETKRAVIASWQYYPISDKLSADPDVAGIVAKYDSQLSAKFKEVIGENKTFLDGERERVRYEETNLGDWVADIMRNYTSADIAFINSGGLRASIDKGPITVESVFKVMPFANEIMTLDLAGKDINEMLKRSVSGTRQDEDGGFLDVSGLKFEIEGKTPKNITVGGRPLDLKKIYQVVVTDFIASGGDGYAMLKDRPSVATGLPLRELIIETIKQQKVIDAKTDGRIIRLP